MSRLHKQRIFSLLLQLEDRYIQTSSNCSLLTNIEWSVHASSSDSTGKALENYLGEQSLHQLLITQVSFMHYPDFKGREPTEGTKAFDMTSHKIQHEDILELNIPSPQK